MGTDGVLEERRDGRWIEDARELATELPSCRDEVMESSSDIDRRNVPGERRQRRAEVGLDE